MIGVVCGKTNGVSPGINFELQYKRFSTFTQCQYTFDLKNIISSFFWDWTGFNINISEHFGLGSAVQIFQPNSGEPFYSAGPMLSFHNKKLAIEVYAYNFWLEYPKWAIGLEYNFD